MTDTPKLRAYISVAAVLQFQRIMGYREAKDGPDFDGPALELHRLAESARLAKDVGPGQESQLWRTPYTVRGERSRLELIVSVSDRGEGALPQLIAVRNKRASGRRRN